MNKPMIDGTRGMPAALAALRLGAIAAALVVGGQAAAVPVTIGTPFMNLENRAVNSLGFASGQFVRWGAVSVTPNGSQGTTGTAIANASGSTIPLNFSPSPLNPNFFSRNIADAVSLRGDWTLRFVNGADFATAPVSLAATAQQAPFVNSITLSGTSANPTFTWTPPPGANVNGYRINIYDKSLITGSNSGQVTNRDLAPSQTSYTVTAADFTVPGYAFTLGKNYSIEISLIQTKDGSGNTSNANLQAIARTYADFTPSNAGGPVINLPVLLPSGAYQFNMTVTAGQTYYIDPDIAVGYDYAIGSGNPNFASVVLPAVGDNLYDIYGFGANGEPLLLAHDWRAGSVFSFATGGVARFRVAGIEVSAALDPSNTTAFATGVAFTGSGNFTGTQTPIVVSVPEPRALLLFASGICIIGWVRRRRA